MLSLGPESHLASQIGPLNPSPGKLARPQKAFNQAVVSGDSRSSRSRILQTLRNAAKPTILPRDWEGKYMKRVTISVMISRVFEQ